MYFAFTLMQVKSSLKPSLEILVISQITGRLLRPVKKLTVRINRHSACMHDTGNTIMNHAMRTTWVHIFIYIYKYIKKFVILFVSCFVNIAITCIDGHDICIQCQAYTQTTRSYCRSVYRRDTGNTIIIDESIKNLVIVGFLARIFSEFEFHYIIRILHFFHNYTHY